MEEYPEEHDRFVDIFEFRKEKSKPGRALWTVKMGDVYMSRLLIDPGVTTGNYFHKLARIMFYVGGGEVLAAFEHVHTGRRMEMKVEYAKHAVHVPPYVALATKNIGHEPAIMIFFSDRPLRDKDDTFEHKVL